MPLALHPGHERQGVGSDHSSILNQPLPRILLLRGQGVAIARRDM
jgi:hypothetical protein